MGMFGTHLSRVALATSLCAWPIAATSAATSILVHDSSTWHRANYKILGTTHNWGKGYVEYLPAGYDDASQTYPLVIFLPGIGEESDGSTEYLLHGAEIHGPMCLVLGKGQWDKNATDPSQPTHCPEADLGSDVGFNAIVLTLPGYNTNDSSTCDFVDYAKANYRVDAKRVYVTGLSMGGYATVKTAFACPEKFAAEVPISINIDRPWPFQAPFPNDPAHKDEIAAWIDAYKNLAYWGFHNADDDQALGSKGCYGCSLHWMSSIAEQWFPTTTVTQPGNVLAQDYQIDFNGSTGKFVWNALVNGSAPALPQASNGINVHTTSRHTGGHNAWKAAYNDPTVWQWLSNQSRDAAPPTNALPVANAGTAKTITLPTSSVTLVGSGTDSDGTIAAYAWTKVSGGAVTFGSPASATTTVSGLVAGSYTFRLKVTDDVGATDTADVVVTVNDGSGGGTITTGKKVKVNLYGGVNPYSNAGWNNWNAAASLSVGNLRYNDGTASTVTARLTGQTGITDNGSNYSVTMCPTSVARFTSYNAGGDRSLVISGLNPSKTYLLELFASRGNQGNSTRFTVGSSSVTIDTDSNRTQVAKFASLKPSASGVITVTLHRIGTYDYLNGFRLTESP